MLSTISWSNYLTVIFALVFVYYVFVIFKFYPSIIKGILKGRNKADRSFAVEEDTEQLEDLFSEFKETFETLEDAKELYHKLLGVITESVNRNLSKVEFKFYIRYILEGYPFVKKSSLRGKINSLMVLESGKHGLLTLTMSEMESLWDETEH